MTAKEFYSHALFLMSHILYPDRKLLPPVWWNSMETHQLPECQAHTRFIATVMDISNMPLRISDLNRKWLKGNYIQSTSIQTVPHDSSAVFLCSFFRRKYCNHLMAIHIVNRVHRGIETNVVHREGKKGLEVSICPLSRSQQIENREKTKWRSQSRKIIYMITVE